MPQNRHSNKALTRQKILDAAFPIYSQYGFVNARFSQIAEKAGLGYGTIYTHFRSKNDILLGLAVQDIEKRAAFLARVVNSQDKAQSKVRLIIRALWTWDYKTDKILLNSFHAHLWRCENKHFIPVMKSIDKLLSVLLAVLADGQIKGQISTSATPQVLVNIIKAVYIEAALSCRYSSNHNARRKLDMCIQYLIK